MRIYQGNSQTPIGKITMASDGTNLIGLWMDGQKYFCSTVKEEMAVQEDLPVFQKTRDWLERYFAGKKPAISELPLAPAGSDFRQEIWKMLCEIPYGEVTTYGALAKKMAEKLGRSRMSAQAVGGAVSHNPISIIIPCHRIVGTNGSLTGYAGGIDKKIRLLELEGVDMTGMKMP